MLKDVDWIECRLTQGDEWGIYRGYGRRKDYQIFLLFVCNAKKESIELGKKLAKLLDKPFRSG